MRLGPMRQFVSAGEATESELEACNAVPGEAGASARARCVSRPPCSVGGGGALRAATRWPWPWDVCRVVTTRTKPVRTAPVKMRLMAIEIRLCSRWCSDWETEV